MNPSLSPLALFSSIGGLIALAAFHGWTSRINHYFFLRTHASTHIRRNQRRQKNHHALSGDGLHQP